MTREILNGVVVWLLVNVMLPIALPLCFALLLGLLVHIDSNIFEILWNRGTFIFVSLFVLISLIPHFFSENIKLSKKFKLAYLVFAIFAIIVLLLTCFLFLSSLNLIAGDLAVPFEDNSRMSMLITICGIVGATVFKIHCLQQKQFNNNQSYDSLTNKKIKK